MVLASEDFVASGGMLIFTAGDTQEDVLVILNNDDISEGNESLLVELMPFNSDTVCDTIMINILDDEPEPTTPRTLIVYMYLITPHSYST